MSDWADIHDEMEVTDRQIAGPVLVTTGEHPQLGAVVAVQADDGMHVLTECLMVLSELVTAAELFGSPMA